MRAQLAKRLAEGKVCLTVVKKTESYGYNQTLYILFYFNACTVHLFFF